MQSSKIHAVSWSSLGENTSASEWGHWIIDSFKQAGSWWAVTRGRQTNAEIVWVISGADRCERFSAACVGTVFNRYGMTPCNSAQRDWQFTSWDENAFSLTEWTPVCVLCWRPLGSFLVAQTWEPSKKMLQGFVFMCDARVSVKMMFWSFVMTSREQRSFSVAMETCWKNICRCPSDYPVVRLGRW